MKLRQVQRFSIRRTIRVSLGLLISCGVLLAGCGQKSDIDYSAVEIEWDFVRTDSLMYACARALQGPNPPATAEAFATYLGAEQEFWGEWLGLDQFPVYRQLPPAARDSVLADQMAHLLGDPKTMEIMDSVREVFPWGFDFEAALKPSLQRLQYHFPDLIFPGFRTHINGYAPPDAGATLDQTIPSPGYFSLGLHYFLGENSALYPSFIPSYIRPRLAPDRLAQATMAEIAEGIIPLLDPRREQVLVQSMIREGIKYHFLRTMLPNASEADLLNYNDEQMEWASGYEARIYKLLIDKLYSTESQDFQNYLGEKPFTTELSQVSAPRIGAYIGVRMVEAYRARHPEVTLDSLCRVTQFEDIFRASRYRP
ncbi:MAG: hypothetical protein AAFV07_08075 [Bacteroidota bacterium]